MFLVLIPVIVPYFISLKLSMMEIFQLQAILGITVAIFEVPSGYLADLWGRKKTICLGAFFSGTGFSILYFLNSFNQLVIYEILLGVAVSLVSGADISILYESLKYKNDERSERTKAIANVQLSKTVSESTASVLGGLLVTISFQMVIIVKAITGWFPFFIALTLKEPPYKKMDKNNHFKNLKFVISHVFFSDRLLILIFINLVLWGLATFIMVWIFQKYWLEENIPIAYFGFIWAGYNLSVGIVGKQVHYLEKKIGPIPLIVAVGLLPIAGYFGTAFLSGWMGIIFGFCFQISRGINQVILKDALNWRVPEMFRATANSLTSLFFRLGFFLVGPVVGYSIDKVGISTSLVYLGLVFLLLFIIFMLPLIKHVREIPTIVK
ncbi:MAG: MFS transporter [Bacteriovoracaceae bacterium]|nr:MFS transporter [Bacteriovoracaceae bacterium]